MIEYLQTGSKLIHYNWAQNVIYGLRTLDLSNLLNNNLINDIAAKSFSNDSTLQRIILPKTTMTIEQSAFDNCSELQIVELDSEDDFVLTLIQYQAFKNCSKLHTVLLKTNEYKDNQMIEIEAEAFSGCYNLRTMQISGEANISDSAFEGCDKDKLCFVCKKNSSVEKYAREHGYRYVNV